MLSFEGLIMARTGAPVRALKFSLSIEVSDESNYLTGFAAKKYVTRRRPVPV